MRLALVSETYPPEINGVAMTLGRLGEGLRRLGHTVDVVRPSQHAGDAPAAGELLVPGLPLPGYAGLRCGWPAGARLLRHWQDKRPDVVHIATEGPLGWSALRAARRLGLPVSTSYHTHFDHYSEHYRLGPLRPLIARYLQAFHRRAQATLAPTAALAGQLAAQGIPGAGVLGRGVDCTLFHPARRSAGLRAAWGLAPDGLAVLSVGRVAAEKNVGLLLASFADIRARVPGARLIVVGDGPLRAALAGRDPAHRFVGAQRGEALAAHYASADLFLFPSLTETFGNVTLEAMASGLPVLAFHHAAAAEWIDPGVSGVTVAPGAEAAFRQAALALARDPPRRRRLGQAARTRAEAAGWPAVIEGFAARLAALQAAHPLPSGARRG